MRKLLVALGLVLAACGADQTAGPVDQTARAVGGGLAEAQAPESDGLAAPSVAEEVADEPSPATTVPSTLASSDEGASLSPLSSQVVELPSALPERVLEGLGDPVGVQPESISIPSLGIDAAAIVPVGLEPNGELEVPSADTVGWYRFGVGVDGGRGSAVLAAHIAYNGRDGVFRDLVELETGDRFTVDRDGEPVEYVIESVADYGKYELPIDDLFSESGEERLVLITCGGDFNPNLRSYDDNSVVVATPVV